MKAEYWWSEERHNVEVAEAYRKGWENAKEECAKVADKLARRERGTIAAAAFFDVAAAIRALKDK